MPCFCPHHLFLNSLFRACNNLTISRLNNNSSHLNNSDCPSGTATNIFKIEVRATHFFEVFTLKIFYQNKKGVMKKLLLLLSCLCLAVVSFAQISPFHYQGVLRVESGDLLSNSSIDVRLSILEGGPGGTAVFQEEISTQTDDFGQFLAEVGGSNPLPELDFQGNSYYLQLEIDQGAGFEQAGGSSLLPTPYASRATFAEEAECNLRRY